MGSEIRVPELGESVLEATVRQWLKKEGDPVKTGEAVVELETDKVNLEVGAGQPGFLARIAQPQGADVRVGDVLGVIEEQAPAQEAAGPNGSGAAKAPAPSTAVSTPRAVAAPAGKAVTATPLAERMAQQAGLELARIPGSGPGGRVTKGDVERHLQESTPPAPAEEPQPPASVPPSTPAERPEERVKMSRRRRAIATRLLEARQNTAMLTTFNEIDMTGVLELRKRRGEAFAARHGFKLGITSFFVKAAVSALKAFPALNAQIEGEEIVMKKYYDIGVAIGDPEGLVVPVIRDADRLSLAAVEGKIRAFGEAVEKKSLSLEDLRGGTFSITNGGVFGSLLSTPLLNYPEVGILGLHRIEERPVARAGQVVICPMMYVALSYDHRIVDGREAVQFLVHIKGLIEDPEALLLEG